MGDRALPDIERASGDAGSGVLEALDMFPSLTDHQRQAVATFYESYQRELVKEYFCCQRLISSARCLRSSRKVKSFRRQPRRGVKTAVRWQQLGGTLYYLFLREELSKRELAACLDKLGFRVTDVCTSVALSRLRNLRIPYRGMGCLNTFRDLLALDEAFSRWKRGKIQDGGVPKDSPWRPVEKELSKARQHLRKAGLLLDIPNELSLQEFVLLCPTLKSVFSTPFHR